jgi:uncharacterized RDD family membrane protein YckC
MPDRESRPHASANAAVEEAMPSRPRPVYQRTLFNEVPRVMPAPERSRPVAPPRASRPQRPPARRVSENQQALNFAEHAATPILDSQVDAVIFCDARAASAAHRFIATALDASLILTAMGLFVGSFAIGGGPVNLDKTTISALVAGAALIWFFYHLLFCLANGDTPGMRWTQLQLVNFDGRRPRRDQRMQRLFSSCLSVAAAFLGIIWALVDEESLTWHDHISKTFPTADIARV